MARRPLTPAEKATAERLWAIFQSKKKTERLTQQQAAERLGWSAAAVVNQYLKGTIPLNLEAGLKFARLLEVAPSEINPEWAEYDQIHRDGEAGWKKWDALGAELDALDPTPEEIEYLITQARLLKAARSGKE